MSREFFVDGSLLEPGNKLAVRQMAEQALQFIAEDRQAANVRDDTLAWLARVRQAIVNGEEGTMSRDFFVDGDLLKPSNKLIVRQIVEFLFRSLTETRQAANLQHDDALDWLAGALQAIVDGEQPNQAFGWEQGRSGHPDRNNEFRNWDIKTTVRDRMRDKGESNTAACTSVSSELNGEFLLGSASIKGICRGITKDSKIPFPENPFSKDPYRHRLRKRRE